MNCVAWLSLRSIASGPTTLRSPPGRANPERLSMSERSWIEFARWHRRTIDSAVSGPEPWISSESAKTQCLPYEEKETSIPTPFLIVVIFWLGVIFTSFGLLAPPNPIVIGSLLICALSVGGAVFLIVDLDQRFSGLIQISSASLRDALSQLGQ
jgi:hypothetical protein